MGNSVVLRGSVKRTYSWLDVVRTAFTRFAFAYNTM